MILFYSLYFVLNSHIFSTQPKNSVLDELRLAQQHLVFKWTSLDPEIKCSEVVASINVEKVSLEIITMITGLLRSTVPIYGLKAQMEVSDAAG